jgi:hypothetical protein
LLKEYSSAYDNFFKVMIQLEPHKRSQSGLSGDWSPKDVISHLIGWDQAVQAYIADPGGFDPDPLYEVDTFNAKSVADRQNQSWEETLDELQSSSENLQKAIRTVTTEMKIYYRLSEWLKGRGKDYKFHTRQLEGWIMQDKEESNK